MKRRTTIRIISAAIAFCAVAYGAAAKGFSEAETYRRGIKNVHMSAFEQLVGGVSRLDAALEKSLYCGTNGMSAVMCAEIWREAAQAKAALSMLPLEQGKLDRTQKFVSQSGEYAYTLLKKTADGQLFGEDDRQNIKSLRAASDKLAIELSQARELLTAGGTSAKAAAQPLKNGSAADGQDEQNEDFPEYAELIYDGPFSEHISKKTPALTKNARMVSREQAAKKLLQILPQQKSSLKYDGQSRGKIKTYCFSSGNIQAELTEKGGFLLNYTDSSEPQGKKITAADAIKRAEKFMGKCGYEHMLQSYYIISDRIITINFAYTDGGVVYYTDLIKVSVFLNGGGIAGLESYGYIMNHSGSKAPKALITEQQAKSSLNSNLKLLSSGLCMVPTSGENQKLCYEFKTQTENGRHCIVYIDAATGREQNIFILIEDQNGVLAV